MMSCAGRNASRSATPPILAFDADERDYLARLYANANYDGVDIRLCLMDQYHGGLLDGTLVDSVFKAEGWLWPGEDETPGLGLDLDQRPAASLIALSPEREGTHACCPF